MKRLKQEAFIMLPTVDFCFKELMQNDNIRKNIIAALLNVPDEMAKKNSELEEAYDVLDKLSADEKKRLEYETRQRAIRDYNIGMLTAERRGIEAGRKIGREEGRAEGETLGVSRINQLILELSKFGRTDDIVKAADDEEYQKKLLEEFDL